MGIWEGCPNGDGRNKCRQTWLIAITVPAGALNRESRCYTATSALETTCPQLLPGAVVSRKQHLVFRRRCVVVWRWSAELHGAAVSTAGTSFEDPAAAWKKQRPNMQTLGSDPSRVAVPLCSAHSAFWAAPIGPNAAAQSVRCREGSRGPCAVRPVGSLRRRGSDVLMA